VAITKTVQQTSPDRVPLFGRVRLPTSNERTCHRKQSDYLEHPYRVLVVLQLRRCRRCNAVQTRIPILVVVGNGMAELPQQKGLALAPLLWPVDGLSDNQLERVARMLYTGHCVEPAKQGRVTTHDGLRVVMYPDDADFVHAFFTAGEKHRRGWAKDVIDPHRVARARWIVPVISGLVDGTQCFRVVDYAAHTKPAPEKRLYVIRDERYIVWLIRRKVGDFRFKTAYVTGPGDIKRYIHRQRMIWER
jgi:hypothetical protein